MDDGSAGEIEGGDLAPGGSEETVLAPDHVCHGQVHNQNPQDHEQQHAGKFHALGDGAGDERGRDDGEHQLVDHERALRNGAGVVCYFMVSAVKKKFGYDDALDAFGVHGIGGTVGAILTGVFATKEVNDLRMGKPMGLIDGNPGQVINNLIGAAIAWGLAIVGTWIILKVCDAVIGLRASDQDEIEGLDLGMHGEEGYNFEA